MLCKKQVLKIVFLVLIFKFDKSPSFMDFQETIHDEEENSARGIFQGNLQNFSENL